VKLRWKGGITLPSPGKYAFGIYELTDEDTGEKIGEVGVRHNGLREDEWKIDLTTTREIDLEKSTLVFVDE